MSSETPEPSKSVSTELADALECGICLNVFVRPVTASCCGQSFCRQCLKKSLAIDAQRRCPTCRQDLRATDLVVNKALWAVAQSLFPEKCAAAPDSPAEPVGAVNPFRARTATASRFNQPRTGPFRFIPPRPAAAEPVRPVPAVTRAPPVPPQLRIENDDEILSITENLRSLDIQSSASRINPEVLDLTADEEEENEEESSSRPCTSATQQRQQPLRPSIRPLAPSQRPNAPLNLSDRPKRVVSGLFYGAAPSQRRPAAGQREPQPPEIE